MKSTKLLSVLSGKGGVGKSVLAFNLAERMAALGRNVLLVDGDINSGNLDILANVGCDFGFQQFASGNLSLKEAITNLKDNLDLLPAIRGNELWDLHDTGLAARIAKRLRQESAIYDIVVLDHSSGVSKMATVMAHASDINLLVVVPELTSIADCYGLYKYLLEANQSIDCHLLINRVNSNDEADYIHKKFDALTERFLGKPPRYFGYLLEDELFRSSIARQASLSALDTDSQSVKTVTELARMLIRDPVTMLEKTPVRREKVIKDIKI